MPTARQQYYEVLAYARLGQRDAAVRALNRFREDYPDHFLIAAAQELIPAPTNSVEIEIPNGDTMRDGGVKDTNLELKQPPGAPKKGPPGAPTAPAAAVKPAPVPEAAPADTAEPVEASAP